MPALDLRLRLDQSRRLPSPGFRRHRRPSPSRACNGLNISCLSLVPWFEEWHRQAAAARRPSGRAAPGELPPAGPGRWPGSSDASSSSSAGLALQLFAPIGPASTADWRCLIDSTSRRAPYSAACVPWICSPPSIHWQPRHSAQPPGHRAASHFCPSTSFASASTQ